MALNSAAKKHLYEQKAVGVAMPLSVPTTCVWPERISSLAASAHCDIMSTGLIGIHTIQSKAVSSKSSLPCEPLPQQTIDRRMILA